MTAGRNRAFDKDDVLESAMTVFWQNGYANTSFADLTTVTGVNKPSLYAAFGNKEQLFVAALELYSRERIRPIYQTLLNTSIPLHERLHTYFTAVAQLFCESDSTVGCMNVNSICELAGDGMSEAAFQTITSHVHTMQQTLTDLFAAEQANGTLSGQSTPQTLALFLISINSGIAVQARSGTKSDELEGMIAHAVQSFR